MPTPAQKLIDSNQSAFESYSSVLFSRQTLITVAGVMGSQSTPDFAAVIVGQAWQPAFINSIPLALAAYNAGRRDVAGSGGIPNLPEKVAYVQKVMRLAPLFKQV